MISHIYEVVLHATWPVNIFKAFIHLGRKDIAFQSNPIICST